MATEVLGVKHVSPPVKEALISSVYELDKKVASLKKGEQTTIYCSPKFVREMGGQEGIIQYIKNRDKMAEPDFTLEELEQAQQIIGPT